MDIRVRFAPSPTGHLHIGGLRTALFNELFARHHGGKLLLRIEDTDRERSKPEYTHSILKSFAWAGITFDEELVIQSHRIDRHKQAIEQLLQEGKAYRCYCTPEEVAARNVETRGTDAVYGNKYDRYCLHNKSDVHKSKPYAVRFKLPFISGNITFIDLIRGPITFDIEQLDDFIIARSDGYPMYNFVVVVDDHDMRISHVIRGEDHISNTPKQILLYQACGFKVPEFAHIPMILGKDGNRLSKRDAAVSVLEYRQHGYMPEALMNYLVRLGWAHKDQEKFSKQEMIAYFDLKNVSKHGARFDQEKLDWLNSVYMKETASSTLLDIIQHDIDPLFQSHTPNFSLSQRIDLIELYKERVKTLAEMARTIAAVHEAPTKFNADDLRKWITSTSKEYMHYIIQKLESLTSFEVDPIAQTIKDLAQTLEVKIVFLTQPMRIALLGSSSGPGVFELAAILGKEETIRRLYALYHR